MNELYRASLAALAPQIDAALNGTLDDDGHDELLGNLERAVLNAVPLMPHDTTLPLPYIVWYVAAFRKVFGVAVDIQVCDGRNEAGDYDDSTIVRVGGVPYTYSHGEYDKRLNFYSPDGVLLGIVVDDAYLALEAAQ